MRPLDPQADRGGGLLSRRTRRRTSPTSTSTRTSSRFAKKHEIFVLSDLAYAEIYFDDKPPPSILQVPGAMDVAVEFTSMSKTFSMAGWRIGFAVGNERLIAALARVKSYLDYGAFTPIQVAATAALNGPQDCIDEMRETYKQPPRRAGRQLRPRRLGDSARRRPRCSPGRRSRSSSATLGSLEFSKLLIEKADVAVAPGIGFGEHGDDYVRIALVENEQRIRQAARNVRRFLETADKTLHNVVPAGRTRLIGRVDSDVSIRTFPWLSSLKVGLAGLGTVGSSVVRILAAPRRRTWPRGRPPGRAGRRRRATDGPGPRPRPLRGALVRRSGRARRAIPSIDVLRRADRRGRRPGHGRGRGRARRRQARGHRQQGAARPSRRRAGARRPRTAASASTSRRRSPAASRSIKTLREGLAGNRIDRVYGILNGTCNYILTRMERREAVLRRLPHGGAAARLCRGRPDLRRRRLRHRPQAGDPHRARLRHRDRLPTRSMSRASARSRRPTSRWPTSSATASSCSASRRAPTPASSSASTRPWCRSRSPIAQVDGVTNAVAIDADAVSLTLVGPGAGGAGHRLVGVSRHCRHRPRRPRRRRSAARSTSLVRPRRAPMRPTRAATTSASPPSTGPAPRRHRPPHGGRAASRWNRSSSGGADRARSAPVSAGRAGAGGPDHLRDHRGRRAPCASRPSSGTASSSARRR